jgi:hypothetical protein
VNDGGPLAATLAGLDATDPHCRCVAGEPDGGDWHRLDAALSDGALLDQWYRHILEGEAQGRRDVAGSYLASWLGGVVAEPVTAALVGDRRTWPLRAGALAVHRHDGGWFDGLAVLAPTVRVLPGDADRHHPDVEVVDGCDRLRSLLADELVALVEPIHAEVRRRAPFGTAGMWGGLADEIAGGVLWRAHRSGGDALTAWLEASALLDAVADRVPRLRARPRLEPIEWSGGTAYFSVKGTCCLFYKAFEGTPDVRGDGYCTSCPLRPDDWRRARWSSWMEQGAAG